MNRIEQTFAKLKKEGKKALIPYITAGDPSLTSTIEMMQVLVKNGADVLELGMAFSDPVADGIVIQKAHLRALKAGMNLNHLFRIVQEFRKTDQQTPIIVMGYLNPIETMGYKLFIEQLQTVGIDGVLIVDLPVDEGKEFFELLNKQAICPIFLVTPTTSTTRLKTIVSQAKGFIYAVSLKGVTGSKILDVPAVAGYVNTIKQYTQLPVVVGFGIHDGASAKAIAIVSDGVIVGSAYVSIIEKHASDKTLMLQKMTQLTQELHSAIANNF